MVRARVRRVLRVAILRRAKSDGEMAMWEGSGLESDSRGAIIYSKALALAVCFKERHG